MCATIIHKSWNLANLIKKNKNVITMAMQGWKFEKKRRPVLSGYYSILCF